MNIWGWLRSLTEEQKPQAVRPTGMSRRGFLQALGVTAVTATAGGVLTWDHFDKILIAPAPMCRVDIDELIYATLEELGQAKFSDICSDLQRQDAMQDLLAKPQVYVEKAGSIQFHVPISPNFKRRAHFVLSSKP